MFEEEDKGWGNGGVPPGQVRQVFGGGRALESDSQVTMKVVVVVARASHQGNTVVCQSLWSVTTPHCHHRYRCSSNRRRIRVGAMVVCRRARCLVGGGHSRATAR